MTQPQPPYAGIQSCLGKNTVTVNHLTHTEKQNPINISTLNARSLCNKLPDVSHFLQTSHIHIMAITETWLNKSIPDSVVNLPGYQPVFRRDRHTEQQGGGVCMYIANQLPAKYRTDLEHPNLELMWTEIYPNPLSQQKHRSLLIGCCYRPPNSPMTFYEHLETIIDKVAETFFGTLSSLLSSVEHDTNLIFLLGDFNAKHTAWDRETITNSAGTFLYNMALDFSLTQCITEPTRFSSDGTSKSTLDLLLTNRPDLVLESHVTSPISDHCCVTSLIEGFSSRQDQQTPALRYPILTKRTGVLCEVPCTEHHSFKLSKVPTMSTLHGKSGSKSSSQ